MSKPPSSAQRAVEITFVLKGHLKNAQLAYLRVAALLAKVRDESLFAALKHPEHGGLCGEAPRAPARFCLSLSADL